MTKIDIDWMSVEDISIRAVASECGYDITKNEKARDAATKPTVQAIISRLDESWQQDYEHSLTDEDEGLYVVSLSDGLAIDYGADISPVLYIGCGVTRNRLRSHLEEWLMPLSNELNDVRLTFHLAEDENYEDAESLLLQAFNDQHDILPLWNVNNGKRLTSKHSLSADSLKPILPKNKRYKWAMRPLASSEFSELAG